MNNNKKKQNFKLDLDNLRLVSDDNKYSPDKTYGIIYARVSTEDQAKHWHGIESQIQMCQQRALNNNVEVVKIFKDEWISGAKLERKGLSDALNFLEKENKKWVKIKYFITTEASRISRSENLIDTLEVDQKIKSTGAKIIYTMHPTDTTTDEGKFIQNFQYLVASYERTKIKARTMNWIKSKILQGYYPWPDAPLWYKKDYVKIGWKDQKILLIKEPEATYLKQALEMFANWQLEYKKDIIDYLNSKWIKHHGKKLYRSFTDYLLNYKKVLFYAGYITRPEQGVEELIEGQHEALIDLPTAKRILERVQNKRKQDNKSFFHHKKDNDFIFKWFLHCPFCWEPMSWAYSTNRKKEKFGYYYCYNPKCPNKKKWIRAEHLEECFGKFLQNIQLKDEIREVYKLILKDLWKDKEKLLAKRSVEKKLELKKIDEEIKSIEEKITVLTNINLINKLEQRWAELEEEKKLIEQELENKELLEISWKNLIKQAQVMFYRPAEIWELWNRSIQKLLIKLIAGKIYAIPADKKKIENLIENSLILSEEQKKALAELTTGSTDAKLGNVCKVLFRTEPNHSLELLFKGIWDSKSTETRGAGLEPATSWFRARRSTS